MKLFNLVETVDNEKYFVKVFGSSFYTLEVVWSKEFNYKRFDVDINGYQPFVPQVYVSNLDPNFKVEVQTTSYGSLSKEEFNYFVEAQQKVLEYIEEIKHIIENE